MFRLRRLNVERVTESEHARDRYIKQGYELVVEQQATAQEPEEEAQEPEEPVEQEKPKGSRNNQKAAQ